MRKFKIGDKVINDPCGRFQKCYFDKKTIYNYVKEAMSIEFIDLIREFQNWYWRDKNETNIKV